METSLIVQLLIATNNSNGSEDYQFGTGCVVGQNQILTAAHVLDQDNSQKVRVLPSPYVLDSENNFHSLPEATIKWIGENGMDVALLSCDLLDASAHVESLPLADTLPVEGAKWDSRGFPTFANSGSRQHHDIIQGVIGPVEPNGQELVLQGSQETWAQTPEKSVSDWCGASGMPVIIEGRIFGVVKEILANCRPPQFLAVPTARLLADKGFLAKFRATPTRDLCALACDLIVKTFEQPSGEEASRCFCKILGFMEGNNTIRYRQIADKILGMNMTEVIDRALEAQKMLRDSGETEGAMVIAELVQAFLPAKHEDGNAIDQVCSRRSNDLIIVPCRSETVAEILIAAADGRSARFATMGDDDEFPVGLARMARPAAETGRDRYGKTFAADVLRDLSEALESRSSAQIETAFFEYLKVEFVRKPDWYQTPEGASEDQLKKHRDEIDEFIRDRLEEYWKTERLAFYYVLTLPCTDGKIDNSGVSQGVSALKRRFPHLAFLVLEPGMPTSELKPYHKLQRLFRSV